MQQEKDPVLWDIAKRRASFKYHLGAYIIMNCFFWVMWSLTGRNNSDFGFPWPLWPLFGWGIGLLFHFMGAYVFPKNISAEKEYEKLTKNKP